MIRLFDILKKHIRSITFRHKEADDSRSPAFSDQEWHWVNKPLDYSPSAPLDSVWNRLMEAGEKSKNASEFQELSLDHVPGNGSGTPAGVKTTIRIAATSNEPPEKDKAVLLIPKPSSVDGAVRALSGQEFLLETAARHGAEIYDVTDGNERILAHYAVFKRDDRCAELLLFIAPQEDAGRQTPGYVAAVLGRGNCLREITSGAEHLSPGGDDKILPAHVGAVKDELEYIPAATEFTPDLFNQTDDSCWTPAHVPIHVDKAEIVEAIAGAAPDSLKITDSDRPTPDHVATIRERDACLDDTMLHSPDSMKIPDRDGVTAEQMIGTTVGTEIQRETRLNSLPDPPTNRDRDTDQESGSAPLAENTRVAVKNEIAVLKDLLRESLEMKVFLERLRHRFVLADFEEDHLGVSFRLEDGSAILMSHNGTIFSAIYTESTSETTTVLVRALPGGIGEITES